ncbi:MAG TPA: hypothetical protein VIR03_00470 [Candidatus Saccharimonadales bacterium]
MNKIAKIIAVLDVLLLVGLGYAVWHRANEPSTAQKQAILHTTSSVISSKASTSVGGAPTLGELSARNDKRRADASLLLGATNEYATSNNGQLPKSIGSGKLQGGAGTSRQFAVMYGTEKVSGAYGATCVAS